MDDWVVGNDGTKGMDGTGDTGARGSTLGFSLVEGSVGNRVLASDSVTNEKKVVGRGLRLFILAFATA